MSSVVEVRMWGRSIGAASLRSDERVAAFQYDPAFATSGIEVAPLMMPLGNRVFRFPTLSSESFHGLPGMLADALPDRFGNALIDAWLAEQGRPPGSLDAIERLSYAGSRAMGALEFRPSHHVFDGGDEPLDVAGLAALASRVLARHRGAAGHLGQGDEADRAALAHILRVGTSAGGARAKAVIALNPADGEVRSGQGDIPPGFEHWIIKFDGVDANRDREAIDDPQGFGAIEMAYSTMARAAGITMSPCRLLAEGPRRHFMTRRFDRTADGRRVHMQSLAALAHLDYNDPNAHSYEQAFQVIRHLGLGAESAEEQFRRMVFNLVARNQDDHVKNIAFLMWPDGRWELAPAFDVVYAHNPEGLWTHRHQMSVNGRRDRFTRNDLRSVARLGSLKRGAADRILDQVCDAVKDWPRHAAEAHVDETHMGAIGRAHRLRWPA